MSLARYLLAAIQMSAMLLCYRESAIRLLPLLEGTP